MNHTRRVGAIALAGILIILSVVGGYGVQLAPFAVAAQEGRGAAPGGTADEAAGIAARMVVQGGNDRALFFRDDTRISSASIKVDTAGNLHAAYVVWAPPNDLPPAVYLFCPVGSNCGDPAAWQGVQLDTRVAEVQLQLTPMNQPRLLLQRAMGSDGATKHYYYYECNSGCTTGSNWSNGVAFYTDGTAISDVNAADQPQRNFALDPQGRPRAFYYDRNYGRNPDHWGGFYTWCDADCTTYENWKQTWIFIGAIFEYPSITFTSDGKFRMVSMIYGSNSQAVYYMECNADCDDATNFKEVKIAERGSEPIPSWDIELDKQDRPRIVMYRGSELNRDEGERLSYHECNADCLKPGSWQRVDVGMPQGHGQDPDLEVDAQGRPRIAWTTGLGNVGFSYCNTACTSAESWTNLYFSDEHDATWRQALPQALPSNCTDDVWKAKNTVLSVDSADVLNIAFDVEVNARCVEKTPGDPTPYIRYRRIWDSVRHISFALNGGVVVDATPSATNGSSEPTTTATSATTTASSAPTTPLPTSLATTRPTTGPDALFTVYLPFVQR